MPMTLDFKYVVLNDALNNYIQENRTRAAEDALLSELRTETRKFGRLAVMQIPEEQGAFLRMLTSLAGARNAIEIGTFTGYSSICIALGLAPGGRLTTCETNTTFSDVAHKYWRKLGLMERVKFVHHEALSFLQSQPKKRQFDFAFIDADRNHCSQYFEELLPRMRVNGVIIFDNALAKGQIEKGKTSSIRARNRLNKLAAIDPRVDALIVPVGDGMLMCRVKL
jgi:caffeoyl-CoA O-methyltransferase